MSLLRHSLLLSILLASPAAAQNLDSLLARMTLEEKLGQLNLLSAGGRASPAQMQLARDGKLGGLFNVIGAENTTPVQRIAVTESRLKIPLLFGLDVIHGYRAIFPIPLAEAGTFDPGAAEATARAAGQEAAAFGINWTYAPMVDIARDPRWGRIAEGSGEDPYLGSLMAAARVRGFQQNIFATVKHFAGYGAAEAGREYNETEVSQRTMREVYLPPFKAAVDAGVYRRLERRQEHLAHRALGDFRLVVLASRFSGAVAGEVFYGGEDVLLEAAHASGGHQGAKVGVLTRAF